MRWFGREPAVLVTQLNGALLALILLLPWEKTMQATVAGIVTAVSALVIAAWVRGTGILPALVGVARTVIALAVVLGVEWDPAYQILLLAAVETVAGIFIRDRVTAPVAEDGSQQTTLRAAA